MLPTFVHVTRVPALIVSKLGLNGPPPPLIPTLEMAVASQVGCGLGLGEVPGLGDALGLGEAPGLGDALGLGDVPGVGDVRGVGEALGLGDVPGVGKGLGLGDALGPPTTVIVDLTPLRASSI